MEFNVVYRNLEARRFSDPKSNVNINNNSTLLDVKGQKEVLNVSFVFTSSYEPNVGVVRIEGELELRDSEKTTSDALAKWEETGGKNLPKQIAEKLHNVIISNCMVEASILARDVRLPVPLPTPDVSIDEKESDTNAYIR